MRGRPAFTARARAYFHRWVCPTWFVSFPKSGRTLTKRTLEAYLSSRSGGVDLDLSQTTSLLPIERWGAFPNIAFTHSEYLYRDPEVLRREIGRRHKKKIILQVRDPRAVVLTYYFQRIRRSRDAFAMKTGLVPFLQDRRYGIRQIVEYMNLWYRDRGSFRRFLLLRYEDVACAPGEELERVLRFLGLVADEEGVARAAGAVSDTTRDIEVGGLSLLRMLRDGEKDRPVPAGAWKSADLPTLNALLDEEAMTFVEGQMRQLDPGFGYSGPPTVSSEDAAGRIPSR